MQKQNNKKSIAIVGMGRFGQTLYRLLRGSFHIVVWDTNLSTHRKLRFGKGDIVARREEDIFACDVIFYAVPIARFEQVLKSHQKYLRPEHLLIDVLSVKTHPAEILQELFKESAGPRAILTHPMFGPDSAVHGFKELPIVMDRFTSRTQEYVFWKSFFIKKGLRVVELAPREHDRLAANSQGVAHFIGRLLEEFKFRQTSIDTMGAKKLHELEAQVCRDTRELFLNLQNYNPYTREMRVRLGHAYDRLYGKLLPKHVRRGVITFGIQGGPGSFNEQAILEHVTKHRIRNFEIKYLFTTERVLRHLHEGRIDIGLFAIQNAVGGLVHESVVALSGYNCKISKEFSVLVRHFLMRRKDNPLQKPRRIMAHDQVFRQCVKTLRACYSQAKLITGKGDLADTARAALALAEGKLQKETFILGPRSLAKLYDLEIVASDLQDNRRNFTTFLLVSRT